MRTPADNEAVVLAVIADRFGLPLDRLVPGRVTVAEAPHHDLAVRALARAGGAVVAVAPEHAALLRAHLDSDRDPGVLPRVLARVAADLPGHWWEAVARTGTEIAQPKDPVVVLDASDPRLPEWVLGHFTGQAWVVLGDGGEVLSTAVLKRYDERLREISVGTAEAARGRGLARSVVAAAARAALAEGRAVLYNHAADNHASARVAEAVGLHEVYRYYAVVADRQLGAEYGEDDAVG